MSLRPLQQLSKSLSSVRDPQQLGQLVGTIADCLDAVMRRLAMRQCLPRSTRQFAAVVINSNDSALDIFQHQEISFQQSPFRARESSSDMSVLMFQNPPPMWRLPEQTVFVLTERDSFCEFDVYAEVGPRRKGPLRHGEQICDNVEPMILVKTSSQWVLMFPSLRGFNSSASVARSSGLDLQTSTWEVGVNPLLGLFDPRPNMRLIEVPAHSRPKLSRSRELTFGWKNYELINQRAFAAAGVASQCNRAFCLY